MNLKPVLRQLFLLLLICSSAVAHAEQVFGDVNEDGVIDIEDVNAVINVILKSKTAYDYPGYADVDGNGIVDIEDVNFLVNSTLQLTGTLPAPKNVRATLNGNKINIAWDAVTGAEKYLVYCSNDEVNYRLVTGNSTGCTFSDVSPLLGTLTYKVRAFARNIVSQMSNPSLAVQYGTPFNEGMYFGFWGFNDKLYSMPIGILNQQTMPTFTSFVNWLQPRQGTALYYAIDNALNSLINSYDLQDASSVTLVTFTDGLDQNSTSLNENYSSQDEYLQALKAKIQNTKINNNSIQAYTIGLQGSDVTDEAQFSNVIQALATDPAHAYTASNIRQVNDRLQEIAKHIYTNYTASSGTDHRKAVVLLALDCSNSLYEQFIQLKASAGSFIQTLANCKTSLSSISPDYSSALTSVLFYTNHATQTATWRNCLAMGDWTRAVSNGGTYYNMSIWYPTSTICTTPYQWWFVGAYGACSGLWGPAENLIDIYHQALNDRNYAYVGVARILRAYGMMLMTDLYGEMPYTEATKGSGTGGFYRFLPEGAPLPKYDTGRTIFMGCINDIEEGIAWLEKAKFQGDKQEMLALSDTWNKGDIDKWIKLGYLLKARWILKLTKKGQGDYKNGKYDPNEILACLDKAQQSNADNTIIRHTDDNWPFHDGLGWDEPIDYSPLFSVCGMNAGYMATKMLEDNLTNFGGYGVEDPRADRILPWAESVKSPYSPAGLKWDGNWRRTLGVDMGSNIQAEGGPLRASWSAGKGFYIPNNSRLGDTIYVEQTSDCKGYFGNPSIIYHRGGDNTPSAESGTFYTRVNSPSYVGTYAEACFIRAEVLFNQGNKAGAFEAYKRGIIASMEQMNDFLIDWYNNEPGKVKECPSFRPITTEEMNNFLNNGIGKASSITLGHILTQKRIALMFSMEIFNDMRRYDYDPNIFFNWVRPAYQAHIDNAMMAIPAGKSFRRWQHSSHEINYNADELQAIGSQVPGASFIDADGNEINWNKQPDIWTIPVWWDSTQP